MDKLPEDYLDASQEILFFLDVLEGRDWAVRYISNDALTKLNWKFDHNPDRDGEQHHVEIIDE